MLSVAEESSRSSRWDPSLCISSYLRSWRMWLVRALVSHSMDSASAPPWPCPRWEAYLRSYRPMRRTCLGLSSWGPSTGGCCYSLLRLHWQVSILTCTHYAYTVLSISMRNLFQCFIIRSARAVSADYFEIVLRESSDRRTLIEGTVYTSTAR